MVRDGVDVLRGLFLVGAVVLIVEGNLGGAVRLVLTVAIVLAPRLLDLARPYDVAFILGMSLQAWGNVFDLFERFAWYDSVVHVVLPAVTAPVLYIALARFGVLPEPGESQGEHPSLAIWVVVFCLGMALDGIYEIYEYVADALLGTDLSHGEADVIADLAAAGAGAAIGGLLLVVWLRRGWSTVRRVPADRLSARRSGSS